MVHQVLTFKIFVGDESLTRKSTANVAGHVMVKDTVLRVVKGSLAEHDDSEVIVNSTDQKLNMGGK